MITCDEVRNASPHRSLLCACGNRAQTLLI